MKRKAKTKTTRVTRNSRKDGTPEKNKDELSTEQKSSDAPSNVSEDAHDETTNGDMVELPNLPPAKLVELTEENCQILDTKLNAKQKAELLEQLQVDDEFFKVASRRALNIEFVISQPSSITSARTFKVIAPECSTVDYLKRRIVKYKLRNNDFIHLDRFCLRRPQDTEIGAPGERLEERAILYNLGFHAGHSVRLDIQSVGKINEEQKEKLIKGYTDKSLTYNDPDAKNWMALLQGQTTGQPSLIAAARTTLRAPMDALPATQPQDFDMDVNGGVAIQDITKEQLMAAVAAASGAVRSSLPSPNRTPQSRKLPVGRRQMKGGAWNRNEVLSLIKGVHRYGKNWANIQRYYSAKPLQHAQEIEATVGIPVSDQIIDPARDPIAFKDKWRNLLTGIQLNNVKRNVLTEEEKQDVMAIELGIQAECKKYVVDE